MRLPIRYHQKTILIHLLESRIKGRPHYYSSKREEYAQLRFDLDADLTPLFNWNTKQLFVYVYAIYSSSDRADTQLRDSQSVIWDKIIPAAPSPYSFEAMKAKTLDILPPALKSYIVPAPPAKKNANAKRGAKAAKGKKAATSEPEPVQPGILKLRDQRAKYQISDITGRIAERGNVTLAVGWNVQPWVGALWWSPGTGSIPRTGGSVVHSDAFDFPVLKAKKAEAGKGTA